MNVRKGMNRMTYEERIMELENELAELKKKYSLIDSNECEYCRGTGISELYNDKLTGCCRFCAGSGLHEIEGGI